MTIHPTAIIDKSAMIADSAIIGPYCIVGKKIAKLAHIRYYAVMLSLVKIPKLVCIMIFINLQVLAKIHKI